MQTADVAAVAICQNRDVVMAVRREPESRIQFVQERMRFVHTATVHTAIGHTAIGHTDSMELAYWNSSADNTVLPMD